MFVNIVFHVLFPHIGVSSRLLIKKGKDSQLVRSWCEKNDNRDNGEKREDINLSNVVHYQKIDEGESVVYTSWWFKKYLWKYRHLKFDNQQPREFLRRKHFKLFSIERPRKIQSFAQFWNFQIHGFIGKPHESVSSAK